MKCLSIILVFAIELFFGIKNSVYAQRTNEYFHLGVAKYDLGQLKEAVKDFNKAIRLNPEFADAYYNRAVVHYQMKQYDKSWQDIDKAQELGYRIERDLLEALHEVSPREE